VSAADHTERLPEHVGSPALVPRLRARPAPHRGGPVLADGPAPADPELL